MKLRHIFLIVLAFAGASAFAAQGNALEVLSDQNGFVVAETPGQAGSWIEALVTCDGQPVLVDMCDASSGLAAVNFPTSGTDRRIVLYASDGTVLEVDHSDNGWD